MDLRAQQKERKIVSQTRGRTDRTRTLQDGVARTRHAIADRPSIHSNVIIKQALLARIGKRAQRRRPFHQGEMRSGLGGIISKIREFLSPLHSRSEMKGAV